MTDPAEEAGENFLTSNVAKIESPGLMSTSQAWPNGKLGKAINPWKKDQVIEGESCSPLKQTPLFGSAIRRLKTWRRKAPASCAVSCSERLLPSTCRWRGDTGAPERVESSSYSRRLEVYMEDLEFWSFFFLRKCKKVDDVLRSNFEFV